ncbi:hypothetical protein KP509_23G061000 [Ceratopteris richardii]|uniref:Vacuolar import/degradation Vid27 C-terminal domain-containing protein n=1 Tax=Ceratopteris richardii TaxID=49495 RepID=A0A8T2S2V4_CERRI|nr:hypothetical protein KP509_23G061000 [Ceratopteris richardii]
MGAGQSRDGDLDDSDSEGEEDYEHGTRQDAVATPFSSSEQNLASSSSKAGMEDIGSKLGNLSLTAGRTAADGNTPKGQWIIAEKSVSWEFTRVEENDDDEENNNDGHEDGGERNRSWKSWYLLVGNKLRVDLVSYGVWALKFPMQEDFQDFENEFRNCLFENTYLLEATEENKIKIFGKEFMGWAKPEIADDSVWEDAKDSLDMPADAKNLREDYVEPSRDIIQSLTMGARDHSYLMSAKGIEAVKNLPFGIQGKGVSVIFNEADSISYSTPKKAMLVRAESNLMVMRPIKESTSHSSGVHQVDVETGKVVTAWKLEKDGTPINMRDVINDSKGAQLDPSSSTFLGLDDNRLCRWDMRDQHGIVQQLDNLVLDWKEGHQFSRGKNFQCFATTGDGGIVVGSKDGKVRLYGTTSMRMAKTAFPGLGSPITHVDVTYDGKWVLATTDSYMMLISTVFKDKDGKAKTGFTGRMGNNIAAPRLLKLSPLDVHVTGNNPKFQHGQFSWVTESGRQERNLVTTVGSFTVVWNFRRVKESNHECYHVMRGLKTCYCYRIIPKEESIVDSKFMHDSFSSASPNAPLVVATSKSVSSFNVSKE